MKHLKYTILSLSLLTLCWTSCKQKNNIEFEKSIDLFSKESNPEYYIEQLSVYLQYEDFLVDNEVIENRSHKSYFDFLKKIAKNDNIEYPSNYPLVKSLDSLIEKYNPNGDDFSDKELSFLNNNNIKDSKSYKFELMLGNVNSRSETALLFYKHFNESDLDCFFIKAQLLDLINSGFKTKNTGKIRR